MINYDKLVLVDADHDQKKHDTKSTKTLRDGQLSLS